MLNEKVIMGLLDQIEIDRIWEQTDYVCAHFPGRLPGTKDVKDYTDYLLERMKSYGLDTGVFETKGYLNIPGKPVVNLLTPEEMPLRCKANAQCGSTPPEGITAELIFVGPGGINNYEGKDATGKIILTELSYSPPRSEKMRIGMMHGAVGMIIMNWGPDDSDFVGNGTSKSVWGNPTPETMYLMENALPVFSVSRKEGVRLRKILESGQSIKVFMNYQTQQSWMPLYIPYGTVHAENNPTGEFILVAGHMDSWEVGASDNAAGNSAACELARVLQNNRHLLTRDVRVAFWQGHEGGQMEGSTWYCDHNWDDLNKHCTQYVNIDGIGFEGASVLHSEPAMEFDAWVKGWNQTVLPNMEWDSCFPAKTADMSFFGIGVPSTYNWIYHTPAERKAWNNAILGLPYHSEADTIDTLDKNIMRQGVRSDASFIFDMAYRRVLPQNFTVMAREIIKRIDELRDMIQGDATAQFELRFDAAREMAEIFEKKAMILESVRLSVEDDATCDCEKLNKLLMKLSRVLMPMLTTLYGKFEQDNYGLTALEYVIPTSECIIKLAQSKAGSHDYWLRINRAKKERNKITDALTMAIDMINDAVGNV